jgi:hypothetical protein
MERGVIAKEKAIASKLYRKIYLGSKSSVVTVPPLVYGNSEISKQHYKFRAKHLP